LPEAPKAETKYESQQQAQKKKPLGSNFRKFLGGVSLTMLGDGFTLLAIPWIATTLTDNALYIAFVSAAMLLPWLLFSLPVGILIDRFSHKTIMVVTSFFRAIIIGTLALIVYLDWVNIPILIFLTFFIGVAKVFFDSTAHTTIPTVVGRDQLERANGYMVTSITTMDDIIGKGVGGILISLGLFIPLMLDALSALLTIPLLLSIKGSFHNNDKPINTEKNAKRNIRVELLEGVRWVWNHSILRGLALINILLTTSFSSLIAIQVLFIQENLGLGSSGFGMLMVIAAIGAIIGGQLAGYLKSKIGTKKGMLLSVLITGLTLGSVGLMNNWMFVGVLFAIGNFSVVIWNVFRLSLLQRIVPEHLLGRVLSVFRFVSWGMSPIGVLLGGIIVTVGEAFLVREIALRLPYVIFMSVQILCFFLMFLLLKNKKIEEV
jgi:MFS family permease